MGIGLLFSSNLHSSKVRIPLIKQAIRIGKKAKNPVYVSPGHKISMQSAKNVVLACGQYKIPSPVREADLGGRDFMRDYDAKYKKIMEEFEPRSASFELEQIKKEKTITFEELEKERERVEKKKRAKQKNRR